MSEDTSVMSATRFNGRIRRNGGAWPVEAGRYRLLASRACPFAGRSLIVRRLMGLEPAISVAFTDPLQDERGWRLPAPDPVLGIRFLSEPYFAAAPGYDAGVSVPVMVDVPSGKVATNDIDTLSIDLATEWGEHARRGAPDLYPEAHRAEIDELNTDVFHNVAIAVYEAGMAETQEAYDSAYQRLFDCLDRMEERLTGRRYLVGDTITEADVRLFNSLARFDAIYHGYFKCNRNLLAQMPALWAYARDLFQTPGFGDTVDFDDMKRHYFTVLDAGNPHHIVAGGPDLSGWLAPHGRDALGGRPFGEGTPPGPPPAAEAVPPAGRPG
ncbi:glutathione S-transferase C-terminal domain-containing protein [Streptomyces otsuchiensis]|uniref:glutathione S-transferase C-terminal domain-containing protein n=1 Tax=Streptomyces otsuchiensis TaxID=2681388 RepID=UPI001030FFB9